MGGPSRPLRVVRDNSVRAFDNLSAWSSSRWGDVRRGAFLSLDRSLPRSPWIDRYVLMARFFRAHKRLPLDVSDPKAGFNDLIFHRLTTDSWKLLERFCIDKEFVKLFVSAVCPGVRWAKNLKVLTVAAESDVDLACEALKEFSGSPAVAKPTHGSGTVLFLKRSPSEEEIMRFVEEASKSYYYVSRESQYKNLEPKIIIEEDLSHNGKAPSDFKFFCARGEVLFCQVDTDRFTDHRRLLVSPNFDPIDVKYMYEHPVEPVEKPKNFEQMLKIARHLSKYFYFSRVDLYSIQGETYFSELTFAPEGGAGSLSNEEFGVTMLHRIRGSQTVKMGETAVG